MSTNQNRLELQINELIIKTLDTAEQSIAILKGDTPPKGNYELGYRDAVDTAIIMLRRVKAQFEKDSNE